MGVPSLRHPVSGPVAVEWPRDTLNNPEAEGETSHNLPQEQNSLYTRPTFSQIFSMHQYSYLQTCSA